MTILWVLWKLKRDPNWCPLCAQLLALNINLQNLLFLKSCGCWLRLYLKTSMDNVLNAYHRFLSKMALILHFYLLSFQTMYSRSEHVSAWRYFSRSPLNKQFLLNECIKNDLQKIYSLKIIYEMILDRGHATNISSPIYCFKIIINIHDFKHLFNFLYKGI